MQPAPLRSTADAAMLTAKRRAASAAPALFCDNLARPADARARRRKKPPHSRGAAAAGVKEARETFLVGEVRAKRATSIHEAHPTKDARGAPHEGQNRKVASTAAPQLPQVGPWLPSSLPAAGAVACSTADTGAGAGAGCAAAGADGGADGGGAAGADACAATGAAFAVAPGSCASSRGATLCAAGCPRSGCCWAARAPAAFDSGAEARWRSVGFQPATSRPAVVIQTTRS